LGFFCLFVCVFFFFNHVHDVFRSNQTRQAAGREAGGQAEHQLSRPAAPWRSAEPQLVPRCGLQRARLKRRAPSGDTGSRRASAPEHFTGALVNRPKTLVRLSPSQIASPPAPFLPAAEPQGFAAPGTKGQSCLVSVTVFYS